MYKKNFRDTSSQNNCWIKQKTKIQKEQKNGIIKNSKACRLLEFQKARNLNDKQSGSSLITCKKS